MNVWLGLCFTESSMSVLPPERRSATAPEPQVLPARITEEPTPSPGDAEGALRSAVVLTKVRRALARISEAQRSTLELAFFGGLTYLEIAARESAPPSTIKSRAACAMTSLREALDAESVRL